MDSTVEETILYEAPGDQTSEQWSPDSRWIIFNDGGVSSNRFRLKALPVGPSGAAGPPIDITDGRSSDYHSSISPDGRFIAYDSNNQEVFVRTFPPTPARWQISVNGGVEPHWSRDGRELYYFARGVLWAVTMTWSGDRIQAGVPKQLFAIKNPATLWRNRMIVAPDGRFLINTRVGVPEAADIRANLLLNWRSLVKE